MAATAILENNQSSFSSLYKNQLQSDVLVCRETTEAFRDITVVKALNKAKFPVYLVNSKVTKQNYAMKVFPYANNKQHAYFQNESRFSFVNHPNVIKTHHVEQERETISKGCSKKVSYTIMEFAPNGDFFDFIMNHGKDVDDKLMRTYFRQLIDGVEYLHSTGVSHMDLKLENLLVGSDFSLKIADFDLSHFANDSKILSRGTKFYRPPEVIQGRCQNTQAADVYSAGIILFTFLTKGMLPHAEDNRVGGVDFAGLLYTQNDEFWNKHCEIQKKEASFFSQDFKELFNAMIALNPEERATIQQIKQSAWYNGPVYTSEELRNKVSKFFGL
jgi:serine/threonine protein kinase